MQAPLPYAPRLAAAPPTAARAPRQPRALRLVALQITLTLGLLGPLLCVAHCAIHAGHAHHAGHIAAVASDGLGATIACGPTAHNHTPPTDEPSLPTPRALYELIGGALVLMAPAAGPRAALARRALALPRALAPAPPTPPPRHA